ncbi:YdhR family protein [Chryseobacterium antibioticum]|uniref:YdhR family protein n=1 Tax=Chryseobacterium pyrolae TaxID=2987481 RepID=A0ABT2IBS4_9FLAO|nr:YdhR family protein [Chryseobacterium pyrolae]MCT2406069.1 YdhR family protein [Chryseobacterium pyrolae]
MKYGQVFTYTLELDSKEDYIKQFVDPFAETISNAKGLISKVWMADFDTQFCSFYLWETKEDMDSFMATPEINVVANLPFLKDLKIVAIPVVDEASIITRGI